MVKLPSVVAHSEECDDCGACVGRREFFQTTLTAGVVGALLAVLPRSLSALQASWIVGLKSEGTVSYPIPVEDGVHVDRSAELIVVRHEGTMSVFALSCPHQRAMLRWRENKGIFQCSKHHSEYTPDGVYLKGRATRNMDRLAIRLDETGQLVVDLDTVLKSDEDPERWAAAVVPIP